MTPRFLPLWFAVFALTSPLEAAAPGLDVVKRWLLTHANTRSLKVDFVQSRSLKAIKNPLVQSGTLWMDYETKDFRWQLGEPAKTIVVSQGDRIAIMRTPLKRVEFRDLSEDSSRSGGFSSLTDGGFPKSLEEFQRRYRILDVVAKGNAFEIITRPMGPAGEGIEQFGFVIDQQRFLLKGLVITLKDGSTVTTTFQRVDRNPAINRSLFHPDLSDYRQTTFRQ